MPRQTTPKPPATPDPLADLREDDAPGLPGGSVIPGNSEPELEADAAPIVADIRPMVTEDTWETMVTEMVVAWHQDLTSQGFLHGGGQCGCRYIASHALRVAVPVITEADLEERDLDPADD